MTAGNRMGIASALVVDDDDFMLDLLQQMLQRLGVKAIGRADNGAQALAELEASGWPELLICDLAMPGMDGIEFLRHLADLNFSGGIVLFSGVDLRILLSAEQLGVAHGLRMLGVLEKPVSFLTLSDMLLNFAVAGAKPQVPKSEILTAEEISAGIADGCVTIYVQPKVDILSRQVVGVECLARWQCAQRGILPPSAFIEVAEQAGLIGGITQAVFRQAAHWAGEWKRNGQMLKVSINISMNDLDRLDLPEQLGNCAKESGIPNDMLVLELTESRLMGDRRINLDIITRLRLKSFGLSIDDFGTGYSTLDKLKNLPFTELKIDRTFVHGSSQNKAAYAILESSARLAQALDLSIVAEGVETQDDWNSAAQLGIDEVQGYLVARPMPAAELLNWIESWEARSSINLNRLRDIVGSDPTVQQQVLEKFLETARFSVQGLADSGPHSRPEEIAILARRLKTRARSIGAIELADTCQALEDASDDGANDESRLASRSLIDNVVQQFAPVAAYIESRIALWQSRKIPAAGTV